MSNSKEEINIQNYYGKECSLPKDEFIKNYNINLNGLSSKEANDLLLKNGPNEIKNKKPKKWYNFFLESLLSPFNCILLCIIAILFYTDVYLPETPSYANIIVIAILVISSTLLDFFEEYRSNKAAEKLKELVATTATVLRDGKKVDIPIKNLVLGDIVYLSAGSMIPADLRILEETELYINQSSLTGESDSVKKVSNSEFKFEDLDNISDLDTICFMGTNVISGSAKCAVIKTADNTYFGKVSHTISEGKPKSAFEVGIQNISKLLIRFMIILTPIVFMLNVWKHDTITAFTFAVAIGICITPLLLPVILSSSLSKGAVRMSKKKTIIKKLDSIQNFGAMNILCTDKTGTLTENKIVLEKYLDINGEEKPRILKHAFLNSYFQTGLKGSIDEAVIKRGLDNNLEELKNKYQLVTEIPFDFTRRRLSVIVSDGEKKQLITKGAVEEILNICAYVDYKKQISPITNKIKNNVLQITKNLNKEGLKVIAVCQKNDLEDKEHFNAADEKNMVLLGFVGFLDPPKESAKIAISKLNKLGIRVMVLTGDNTEVTKSVCSKVGINSKEIIEGSQIEKLTDSGVIKLLRRNNIFTRLTPIQKARIVRLLKVDKNIVGYMGDGINDAPSLINSDVGISVDTAVDIAKESADIILLEKDLQVLIDGVKERKKNLWKFNEIYQNGNKFQFW